MSRIKFPLEKKPGMHGDGFEATHPGFGVLEISRVTGHKENMVGVDFPQGNAIHLQLRQARMYRAHGGTSFYGDKIIADFYMSELQWAQAITSLNSAHRNPVTLAHYRDGDTILSVGDIPPHMADLDQMVSETAETIDEGIEALEEAIAAAKAGKVKKSIVEALEKAHREIVLNRPFFVERAKETIDEAASKAKVEIRAFAENVVRQYGLKQLGADGNLLIALADDPLAIEDKGDTE